MQKHNFKRLFLSTFQAFQPNDNSTSTYTSLQFDKIECEREWEKKNEKKNKQMQNETRCANSTVDSMWGVHCTLAVAMPSQCCVNHCILHKIFASELWNYVNIRMQWPFQHVCTNCSHFHAHNEMCIIRRDATRRKNDASAKSKTI